MPSKVLIRGLSETF